MFFAKLEFETILIVLNVAVLCRADTRDGISGLLTDLVVCFQRGRSVYFFRYSHDFFRNPECPMVQIQAGEAFHHLFQRIQSLTLGLTRFTPAIFAC